MERSLLCRGEESGNHRCLRLGSECFVSNLKLLTLLCCRSSKPIVRSRLQDRFPLRRNASHEGLGKGIISWSCQVFVETGVVGMESSEEKCEERGARSEDIGCESEAFSEFGEERRESNSSTGVSSSSSSDAGPNESCVGPDESSKEELDLLGWRMRSDSVSSSVGNEKKIHQNDDNANKPKQAISELEMMKERFAKLLLGEDMSGCGKGVCSAMAISNAITNLCATLFGQLWRLEPLSDEKKSMWRREMDWLVCVSDHIVEFKPSWQTFHDGSKLEVMSCRPRPDLYINLPALRKLDNMLIEVLDSFKDSEFWYVDKGILAPETDGSVSFHRTIQHQEKWWLPSPRVPPSGLSEKTRRQLVHKRECTNQILKAATAINSNALAEMEIPESYIESLPKNGRTSLGEVTYRYITSDKFYPDYLLDCLDLSSEHQALELANRAEAASFVWRRRSVARTPYNPMRANPRPSWGMVKEIMMVDGDKRELLASRAESLLICLKQRFPGLTQTTLDMSKIQFNKDIGKSILEAYSRVLESLAFNIIARIDDLFYVDDLIKNTIQLPHVPEVSIASQKKVSIPFPVPVSGTPYKTLHTNKSFSPQLLSPARGGERSPFINKKMHGRGFGVKKVLTDYLGVDSRDKGTTVVSAAGKKKA
ncbi:hypothetical protein M5K25_013741 [Dendrobium thyrsiflorum]|uniref:PRONE domain-containing protein n=1 Tax=Dendrobium thyrsiflorum TaxID=117978 RepID=A0ABD0UTS6_DENTH